MDVSERNVLVWRSMLCVDLDYAGSWLGCIPDLLPQRTRQAALDHRASRQEEGRHRWVVGPANGLSSCLLAQGVHA